MRLSLLESAINYLKSIGNRILSFVLSLCSADVYEGNMDIKKTNVKILFSANFR